MDGFRPNFGTKADLNLVKKTHAHGIRIVLDGVINHTGPITETDVAWPNYWVRTSPVCDYKNYQNTTECTLVANLPDIRTEHTE
jgi:alpha-amylase